VVAALGALYCPDSYADQGDRVTFSTSDDPDKIELALPATTDPKAGAATEKSKTAKNDEEKEKAADGGSSLLREYLHSTSFDAAANASREVENTQSPRLGANECEKLASSKNLTDAARGKYIEACNNAYLRAKQSAETMKAEAGKIRKQQELFSDISRISDVAAVGAVGATAVSQLAMKDDSQAKSLEKVAKIQNTAGKAAYASGATDLTLGAAAYLHQKRKLEQLKDGLEQEIKTEGQIISVKTNGASISNLQTAINKTKEAAYKHLLVGAGKVATGFASMKLAESNKKQAEKLKSLELVKPNIQAEAAATVAGGPALTYTNNSPGFFVPDATGGSSSASAALNSGVIGSGGGTSVMPTGGNLLLSRRLASSPASGGGVSGGSGSAGSGSSAENSAAPANQEEGKTDKTAEALGDAFELNLTGGASRYGGGYSDRGGDNPVAGMAALFSGLLGQDNEGGAGTGNTIAPYYGDEGEAYIQGATEDGVHAGDSSLFEIVKSKHNKMMQAGRLTGPGEVVTR